MSALTELEQAVRIGLYTDATLEKWKSTLERLVSVCELEFEAVSPAEGMSQAEQLKFISLKSEFYDMAGNDVESRKWISQFVQQGEKGFIERIQALRGTAPALSQDEDYARWIRQVAWVHLQYAWVMHYRRNENEKALNYLNDVLHFVEQNLKSPKRPSHGTYSRYFHYLGHCLRGLRRFRESEEAFLKSQEHANLRFAHKDARRKELYPNEGDRERASKLALQRRFAIISTARQMGSGMTWSALQQGQLSTAVAHCTNALGLLAGTGQEPTKAFIRSMKLIAQRRLAPGSTLLAGEAMKGLYGMMKQYSKIDDSLGELRCGAEIARGYMDYLEFWAGTKADRVDALNHVLRRIAALTKVAVKRSSNAWKERLRMMEIRASLAFDPSRVASSDEMQEVVEISRNASIGLPRKVEARILLAIHFDRKREYRKGIEQLSEAFLAAADDPVLRAECLLHSVGLHSDAGDKAAAEDALGQWAILSRSVENVYLHQLSHIARTRLDRSETSFVIAADEADLRWERWEAELKQWLVRQARIKAGPLGKEKEIAAILGILPSTWSRWPSAIKSAKK